VPAETPTRSSCSDRTLDHHVERRSYPALFATAAGDSRVHHTLGTWALVYETLDIERTAD
jgi:hypothetical protein